MGSYRNKTNYIRHKINYQITAPTVRLVDEDSKQIGVVSLAEAKSQSQTTGLDLVEIAPNAKPPVVKLISFSKFKYQESKKLQAEKRGIKGGEMKEIQMSPFIGQNDFDVRVKWAQKFLSTGNKIKLSVKFQGRQIQHKEFGYKIVDRFKASLQDLAQIESEPKLLGKVIFATFSPVKKRVQKQNEATQPQVQN